MLSATLSDIFNVHVLLHIVVDSKDLFNTLSTQRNSIDKSIRPDVSVIRHEFERGNVNRITWIPGRVNIADAGTKPQSPLTEPLILTLADGKLCLDLSESISRDSNRSFG